MKLHIYIIVYNEADSLEENESPQLRNFSPSIESPQ